MHFRAFAFAFSLLAVGCGPADYSFVTSRTDYLPGESVDLVFTKVGGPEIALNVCFAGQETRVGEEWVTLDPPGRDDVACPLHLSVLTENGATVKATTWLFDDQAAGQYRFFTEIEVGALRTKERAFSDPFHVVAVN